ncbi:hypothetical protein [Alcaligenes endophyticus]|uniref:Uncharacterized protein n=1 Tax=Alcaligenes endophyticus TaxID=1929088 RepID=A0ABT8EHG6_9BURK|nr:hypothetical protein [Alcaligenes endophyticus]MCX5592074.1 hypothetical protein [Alcaligenes endophyticus]MDN4120721.1 hypothetical protein [Alcaligenes endophyticus]
MPIQSFQWLVTVSDNPASFNAWDMFSWLYRLPGSIIIEILGHITPLAALLNIQASRSTGYATLDGRIVNVVSLFIWAATILWILHTSSTPSSSVKPRAQRKAPSLHRPYSKHGKTRKTSIGLKTRFLN